MAIKGVKVDGITHHFDYEYLENKPTELPDVSAADAGKILTVNANGEWEAATVTLASEEILFNTVRLYSAYNYYSYYSSPADLKSRTIEFKFNPTYSEFSSSDLEYIKTYASSVAYEHFGGTQIYGVHSIELRCATSIHYDTFASETGLIEASIFNESNSTIIEESAFASCRHLTSITMPLNCSVDANAFKGCIYPEDHILNIYLYSNAANANGSCTCRINGRAFGDEYSVGGDGSDSESSEPIAGEISAIPGLSIFVPSEFISQVMNCIPPYSLNVYQMPSAVS